MRQEDRARGGASVPTSIRRAEADLLLDRVPEPAALSVQHVARLRARIDERAARPELRDRRWAVAVMTLLLVAAVAGPSAAAWWRRDRRPTDQTGTPAAVVPPATARPPSVSAIESPPSLAPPPVLSSAHREEAVPARGPRRRARSLALVPAASERHPGQAPAPSPRKVTAAATATATATVNERRTGEQHARGTAESHTGALGAESRLLGAALGLLRNERNAAGALAALDDYARRFPDGTLAQEARSARIEAYLALGRKDEALALLDRQSLRHELRVVRAELLLEKGRTREALADFEASLAGAHDAIEERALYGRAACRSRLGDAEGARQDLEGYLERFPRGRFATTARETLVEGNRGSRP